MRSATLICRNARNCYDPLGALGSYATRRALPVVRRHWPLSSPPPHWHAVKHLDVETVVKASRRFLARLFSEADREAYWIAVEPAWGRTGGFLLAAETSRNSRRATTTRRTSRSTFDKRPLCRRILPQPLFITCFGRGERVHR